MRFLPKSIPGQLALVMASALLVASAVNFLLLLGERHRASIIEQSGPPIARFVDVAYEVFETPPPDLGLGMRLGRPQGPGRYQLQATNPVDSRNLARDAALEGRLTAAMRDAGLTPLAVRASTRAVVRGDRPGNRQADRAPPNWPGPDRPDDLFEPNGRARAMGVPPGEGGPLPLPAGGPREAREVVLAAQIPDGRWLASMSFSPEPNSGDEVLLGASTFVTFAFVLAAALWIAGQVSRPLKDLAAAAARVGAATKPEEVPVQGYGEVRQTLEAFNAMSRRVSQLLSEKDVMLGALGHDLRTPLASLRIRIESMEPESERQKAVRTIEEATQLLEDILQLARQGRTNEPERTMDLSIVVQDIVEDYSETGAPVTLETAEKAPAACRAVLFGRALRNLIDNAVAYGERARVSVARVGDRVEIQIEDDGPGMSEDGLASATDPFVRGEASRNRATGGAGLGLTLADAIVKAHRGTLTLRNRTPRGLSATISLPLASPAPVA